MFDEHRTLKLGGLIHLRKPVEPDLLRQAIVRLGLRVDEDRTGVTVG
jgi:hypothetical protein